jgi:hypothetical protein
MTRTGQTITTRRGNINIRPQGLDFKKTPRLMHLEN